MADVTVRNNYQLLMTDFGIPSVEEPEIIGIADQSSTRALLQLETGLFLEYLGQSIDFVNDEAIGLADQVNVYDSLAEPPILSVTDVNLDLETFIEIDDAVVFLLSGSDSITGGDLSDVIFGYNGNDLLLGGAGEDSIFGGPGNDTIDGGVDRDTVRFVGSRGDYAVEEVAGQVQVTDNAGIGDGVDTVRGIEAYRFSDGEFTLSQLLEPETVELGVYRFFNFATGTHFYTANAAERDGVMDTIDSFDFEGPSFRAIDEGDAESSPVYRFFNTETGVHFYTIVEGERQLVEDTLPQFVSEGVGYSAYAEQVEGSIPLYRFFNTQTSTHFYTPSEAEKDAVIADLPQFSFEGIGYYVDPIA